MIGQYEKWRPNFGQALDRRRHTLEWLDAQVESGVVTVWWCEDAAMLTELRSYPTGLVEIHGLVAAGNLKSIARTLIPQAERWAAKAGCSASVIESRKGWERTLGAQGYTAYQIAVRKDL